MSIWDFIDRLRNESEAHRKHVALSIAFSITGVILIGWFMYISGGSPYSYQNPAAATSTTSPISAAMDAVSQSFDAIKQLVGTLGEASKINFAASSTATTTGE